MNTLSYWARTISIETYANTPGWAENRIANWGCDDSILVFWDLFDGIQVRDIIDIAKINTESRGVIVIKRVGNLIDVSVLANSDGTWKAKETTKLTLNDINRYKDSESLRLAHANEQVIADIQG